MNTAKITLKSLTIILTASLISVNSLSALASTTLAQALAGEQRSTAHKARDQYRHPQQTLEFFGFNNNMTVVEITPGGGWYMEVLAPALKDSGKYIAAQYPDTGKDDYYSNSRKKLLKKIASNKVYSVVKISDFVPKKQSELAPQGSADLVLTFRNLHNWGEVGIAQVFRDAFRALKSNGVLGVVEHRMPVSQNWQKNHRNGYVPKTLVVQLAKEAGFTLVASSEMNANPKDTADHPKGVWTLPPVLRLKETDKAKYLAIGESDRMTLKFAKLVKNKF
ncbi:MAG: methyltransferase [Gammaproteobacteria bacterium]|nr:MAG: methyltransferase [Gammaproteobacteria bacterium]